MPFVIAPGRNPVIAEAFRLLREQEKKECRAAVAEQEQQIPERKAQKAKRSAEKAKQLPRGAKKTKAATAKRATRKKAA